jgi:hypothetical protein
MLITASIKRVPDFSCPRDVPFWPLAAPEMSIFLLVRTSAFGNSRHSEIDLIAHCLYRRP